MRFVPGFSTVGHKGIFLGRRSRRADPLSNNRDALDRVPELLEIVGPKKYRGVSGEGSSLISSDQGVRFPSPLNL